MRIIYKYILACTEKQILDLPQGTQILSVKEQQNQIMVYVMAPTTTSMTVEPVTFYICGTDIPTELYTPATTFLGTVTLHKDNGEDKGRKLAFHVFYCKGISFTGADIRALGRGE